MKWGFQWRNCRVGLDTGLFCLRSVFRLERWVNMMQKLVIWLGLNLWLNVKDELGLERCCMLHNCHLGVNLTGLLCCHGVNLRGLRPNRVNRSLKKSLQFIECKITSEYEPYSNNTPILSRFSLPKLMKLSLTYFLHSEKRNCILEFFCQKFDNRRRIVGRRIVRQPMWTNIIKNIE